MDIPFLIPLMEYLDSGITLAFLRSIFILAHPKSDFNCFFDSFHLSYFHNYYNTTSLLSQSQISIQLARILLFLHFFIKLFSFLRVIELHLKSFPEQFGNRLQTLHKANIEQTKSADEFEKRQYFAIFFRLHTALGSIRPV